MYDMHESNVTTQPTRHRPHNVITLQMRQGDNDVASGWKYHSVTEYMEHAAFVGLFAGIIAKKAVELSYIATTTAIHHLTARD